MRKHGWKERDCGTVGVLVFDIVRECLEPLGVERLAPAVDKRRDPQPLSLSRLGRVLVRAVWLAAR
eukprot:1040058-Rhodomonas_salina.4